MRKWLAIGTGLSVLVIVAVAIGVARDRLPFWADASGCVAEVDGHRVELDVEQAENAALITAISVRRGLPARAATIALATAYQESDLRNIDYGDRDSLGLFQQRPSQGWGSAEQVQDAEYATNAFYDALVEVGGYRDMEITVAAQLVQRSAFPRAYADHEPDARVLASALTGHSQQAFVCDLSGEPEGTSDDVTSSGLTERADRVRADIARVFGDLPVGGFSPEGVSTGHQEGSTHYEGRAVDVFFRPVNANNKRRGWALASYLVAHAERLAIQYVIFDDRIWRAGSDDAWRDYDVPDRPGDRAILEHRDHVHVDVYE